MQTTINQTVDYTKQYPEGIIENIVRFSDGGFSPKEMSILTGHKVPFQMSYAVFVRPKVLHRGYVGTDWRRSHK